VYVDATVTLTPLLVARTALTPYGDRAHASHATAARIHGLPIPTLSDEHVTVIDQAHRRTGCGARVHVDRDAEVTTVHGVPVSSPRQTFLDLAGMLDLVDLVALGDAIVRAGRCTAGGLVTFCAASRNRSARAARRAAALVRAGVDSPMETRLRLLLVFAGLPEPEVNRTIRVDNGDPVRKYDLSWPAVRVIVEYDGRHHVERIEQWESDLDRREAIDDEGWRILVVTSRGIFREPGRTVDRVWRLLRSRGLPGLPARPSDGWKAHFPGYA
jgi:very-short-patch-repair endonuclease